METVDEITQRDVVTARPDDGVKSQLRLLRRHEPPGVFVVEARGAWWES